MLLRPDYANMLDPWWPGWFRAAVVALVALVVLLWFGLLRRRMGSWTLVIGALGLLAVLGVVMAAVVPGGSYLAALPALAGALGVLATLAWPAFGARVVAGLLAGAVAVAILVPTVYLFFPALGLATGAAAALFSVMLGLALLPVFDLLYPDPDGTPSRRWAAAPALAVAVAAVLFTGIGLRVDHFDADHPAPAELAYILDTDAGQAQWVSTDARPGGRPPQSGTDPGTAAATAGPVHGPVTSGPPDQPARLIYLALSDASVLGATLQGREVPADELTDGLSAVFHAPAPEGIGVTLELGATGPVTRRVLDGPDGREGLPGFTPRPAGVGIAGSHTSEMAVVAKAYTF